MPNALYPCPHCGQPLELATTRPEHHGAVYRLAGVTPSSAPRFGTCSACSLLIEDVEALRALEGDERQLTERARKKAMDARAKRRTDNREAMSLLAEAFHVLDASIPGVRPWDPDALIDWWKNAPTNQSARDAAAFVLSVWNLAILEEVPFDVMHAVARWDDHNRAAFATWAADPWWA